MSVLPSVVRHLGARDGSHSTAGNREIRRLFVVRDESSDCRSMQGPSGVVEPRALGGTYPAPRRLLPSPVW